MLLAIVLSCTMFGFLYDHVRKYILKSLIWLTWYYLWSGLIYIYLIKGIIQFFNEDDIFDHSITQDYTSYQSSTYQILLVAAYLMIIMNFVNFVLHVVWKKDLIKYFQKVIFKNEVRKEISVRYLSKNFIFPLEQISGYFFNKKKKEDKIKGK